MTYSLDFRKKALLIKAKEGLSFARTAERFDVGIATLVRWTKRLEPQKNRNKPATKMNNHGAIPVVSSWPTGQGQAALVPSLHASDA